MQNENQIVDDSPCADEAQEARSRAWDQQIEQDVASGKLHDFLLRQAYLEWAEDHNYLQARALALGIPRAVVEGDSFAVPSIQDLVELIIEHLQARERASQ